MSDAQVFKTHQVAKETDGIDYNRKLLHIQVPKPCQPGKGAQLDKSYIVVVEIEITQVGQRRKRSCHNPSQSVLAQKQDLKLSIRKECLGRERSDGLAFEGQVDHVGWEVGKDIVDGGLVGKQG